MIYRLALFGCFFMFQEWAFSQESMPLKPVVCHFSEENSFTVILPDDFIKNNARLAATSNIEVNYINFPSQAKTAFEQAVSIWEKYLVSSQIIRITATWSTSLSNTTLAETGASRIYKNISGLPYTNIWYPTPLAEALTGKDLNSGEADINISINGNINWYYGVDAKAQVGKYDMITVLLHEIAHGLGFSSSMTVVNSSTQGQYGQSGSAYIFDTFMQDSQKIKLTNSSFYGNPSTGLKVPLISNALFFGLTNTKFANSLPRLYAPSPYKEGSSFSHFDESTYPAGTANSLMSPSVRAAEVNQNPGELLLNCLSEMGWYINGLVGNVVTATESVPEQNFEVKVFPNPVENYLNIAFPLQSKARNIKFELLNMQGQILHSIEKQSVFVETYTFDVRFLPEGIYFLKVIDGEKIKTFKVVK
jgi:hypothetical protein